jgi:hypothetical protein
MRIIITYACFLESESNQLWKLTTDGDNNAARILQLIYIQNSLVAQLFEIELVSGIEISRIGLRVVLLGS